MSEPRTPEPNDRKDLLKRALVRMEQLEAELRAVRERSSEPIALIGMGCRFPGGASDIDGFRKLLHQGFDATCDIPADRWDVDAYYDADPDTPGTMYVRRGAFLTEPVDRFDASFFGIAPREADELDPQQRLLAEVVWEALERAGQSPAALRGSATGMFLGMAAHDWSRLQGGAGDTSVIGTYYGTGSAHSVAAGRISYILGLRGPAVTIDTACSSSLVAFHAACQSLRTGETRMAIAAGVSLILAPDGHVIASRGRMLSPKGRCHTFDAAADGYVRGEGCAVVLLKRLSDTLADGDSILALVRGTATNQDGRSGGLTVPSGTAQEDVMRTALAASGLQPGDVDYVEAHGTGTELGDPIEVHALAAVHAERPADRPLMIGSVKTNVGHLEAAAGLAGVLKSVIALQDGIIPPHLHFTTPNPHITWDAAPIVVPTQPAHWPRSDHRIAGVSSFGFSGTNAHVILESYAPEQSQAARSAVSQPQVVTLSGRTPEALTQLAAQMADRIDADPSISVDALARTLTRGRAHWEERLAIIATDAVELVERLRDAARPGSNEPATGILRGTANLKRTPRVAFLFTGQGSQRPGMGRELLDTEPVFRETIATCDAVLSPRLGLSIIELMRADSSDEAAGAALQQTRVTQPALFALEYALAQLWRSWGVEPTVVLGHSIGEYVAACVAGVLSLEDALMLVAERGRLMGELPAGGAMAAVFAGAGRVRPMVARFEGRVSIAAENSRDNTVVSGDEDAIDEMLAALHAEGIDARRLVVSHAFHSHRMEPVLESFRAIAARVTYSAPQIDVICNVTGERAHPDTFGADYWVRQIREPVQFARCVDAVRAEGVSVLLEAGPAPVLLGLAAAGPDSAGEVRQPTLRPGLDAARCVREALAGLYIAGVPIDWNRVYGGPLHPVPLPTYPFQRQRHWFAAVPRRAPSEGVHPLLGRRIESPLFEGTVFETVLYEDSPAWLGDHRVFGRPVVPAAAYVEMCRAAVSLAGGTAERPADIRILEPLYADENRTVQTIVDTSERTVRIVSRAVTGSWRAHVTGRIETASQPRMQNIDAPANAVDVDATALLARIRASGVTYGSTFQSLRSIRRGGSVAEAELAADMLPSRERRAYLLHPALLDAAFQLCGACVDGTDDIYLPVEIEGVEYPAQIVSAGTGSPEAAADRDEVEATHPFRVRASLREGGAGAAVLVCDVQVAGPDGLLSIRGLRFQRAANAARAADRRAADWLYSTAWPNVDIDAAAHGPGSWLVVGDDEDAGVLGAAMHARGRTVQHVSAAAAADALQAADRLDGLVFLPARSNLHSGADAAALRPVLEPLLEAARAFAGPLPCDRLCIVTRGAWSIRPDDIIDPGATAVWGLANTIAAELSHVDCVRVDLAHNATVSGAAAAIADAAFGAVEDRLALRGGDWHAARLTRVPAPAAAQTHRPSPDYRLEVRVKGDLSTLALGSHEVAAPGPDQVTIRVQGTGLNFRDVLNALDMYPGDAGPLGSECVGVVEAAGAAVRDLRPGDVVMSITPRGFCSRVNSSAAMTVRVPKGMTTGDAATVPIAFLTADWALHELARLRGGERVLIHAAAGGVGMAAVQLARAAGAEVFATAGSRRKRELLQRMGVRHIYDSRSLAFRDAIMRDTDGEGVHVVLNSLADDFIPASLDVLHENGRFIEIGKTGVWDAARVATVRPHAAYHMLYLGEACEREPDRVRDRFIELVRRFEAGELTPLPVRPFLVDDAPAAFRFMAQARHVGKVVLFDSSATMAAVDERSAVWITGGLGGVGLSLARQLVADGTRSIALTGRSTPTPDTERALAALRAAGADIVVLPCDVARMTDVERARDAINARGWRIDHVLHAAGVLDDAAIARQSWDRFETVLAPKVAGAWNLHIATMHLPVRSFVLFSAGAGLLGSPGQANYAAANAFMDGLALLRSSVGLSASSIAWGPWADSGMAARAGLDWSERGLGSIDADAGAAAMRRTVREEIIGAAVLPIDWSRFPSRDETGATLPFFSLVQTGEIRAAGAGEADWRGVLQAAPVVDRRARIQSLVADEVARVLGLDSTRSPSPGQGLTDLGMDSLMAVELSNRVGRALGEKLPSTFVFEYPTVAAMSVHLLGRLGLAEIESDAEVAVLAGTAHDAMHSEVEAMSEDEASSALLDELEQIGY